MSTMTLERLNEIERLVVEHGAYTLDMLIELLQTSRAHLTSREAKVEDADIPAVARLYYGGTPKRRYRRASTQNGPGEPLCFKSLALELARRQYAQGYSDAIAAQEAAKPVGEVTEAMVDAALKTWYLVLTKDKRADMRAALTAALAATQDGGE